MISMLQKMKSEDQGIPMMGFEKVSMSKITIEDHDIPMGSH